MRLDALPSVHRSQCKLGLNLQQMTHHIVNITLYDYIKVQLDIVLVNDNISVAWCHAKFSMTGDRTVALYLIPHVSTQTTVGACTDQIITC